MVKQHILKNINSECRATAPSTAQELMNSREMQIDYSVYNIPATTRERIERDSYLEEIKLGLLSGEC